MGRDLRAIRIRLAKKRRVIRRLRWSLKVLRIAAAEIAVYNALADQWVHDCLVELENDPLIRNAFETFDAQNLDLTDTMNVNQAQPFRNDGATGGRRE